LKTLQVVAGEWKPDLVDVGEQIREVSLKQSDQKVKRDREKEDIWLVSNGISKLKCSPETIYYIPGLMANEKITFS
jgi:hypothetical protein